MGLLSINIALAAYLLHIHYCTSGKTGKRGAQYELGMPSSIAPILYVYYTIILIYIMCVYIMMMSSLHTKKHIHVYLL